jgi:hypothetical protein
MQSRSQRDSMQERHQSNGHQQDVVKGAERGRGPRRTGADVAEQWQAAALPPWSREARTLPRIYLPSRPASR